MTALYAILSIICIGGILLGAYLIGFDDGVTAEQMRRSLYIIDKHVTLDDEKRHSLTHADLAQLEQEAKNKTEGAIMSEKRPTIYAIDFDGTIVRNKWPDIGEANQPVVDFIKAIQDRGDKWILWTMREGKYLQEAVAWCLAHDLIPDTVNDNLPSLREAFGNNPRKVFANYYIDDHNAGGLVLPPLEDTKNKQA